MVAAHYRAQRTVLAFVSARSYGVLVCRAYGMPHRTVCCNANRHFLCAGGRGSGLDAGVVFAAADRAYNAAGGSLTLLVTRGRAALVA